MKYPKLTVVYLQEGGNARNVRDRFQPDKPADLLSRVRPLRGAHRLDRPQPCRPHPPQVCPGTEVCSHLDSDAKGEITVSFSLTYIKH